MSKTTESIGRKTRSQCLFDSVAHRLDQWAIQCNIRTATFITRQWAWKQKTNIGRAGKWKERKNLDLSEFWYHWSIEPWNYLPPDVFLREQCWSFFFPSKIPRTRKYTKIKGTRQWVLARAHTWATQPNPDAEQYHYCRNFLYAPPQSTSIPSYLPGNDCCDFSFVP